jgi:hypothetical protein
MPRSKPPRHPKKTPIKAKPSSVPEGILLRQGQKVGVHGRPVPLSENERKYHDWTKAECIAYLLTVAKQHPDTFISRNWFRANSEISDSTWNRHFGTFQEYKRSAGVDLSRQQHLLERQIARHSGHDEISRLNIEKANWTGRYEKPRDTRWKTGIACSDVHDKMVDPFWRRVFMETVERVNPDLVVVNGDLFDLPEFGKYSVDPREWDAPGRIQFALDFLGDIRAAAPEAQIDLIEGNHEFRLFRHLAEATPALRSVLSDLHGFTIPSLLGIDRYEINFIGNADLKAWTERDMKVELDKNYRVYWESVLACHYPDARRLHMPGFGGHHHKHAVWPFWSVNYGACEFHQMGCGHRLVASYTHGENWHLGFLIFHTDAHTKKTVFEYVPVQDHAVVGGVWYLREPSESI